VSVAGILSRTRRSKTKTAAGITADGRLNGIFNFDITSDI
jgi:hypothetical protein